MTSDDDSSDQIHLQHSFDISSDDAVTGCQDVSPGDDAASAKVLLAPSGADHGRPRPLVLAGHVPADDPAAPVAAILLPAPTVCDGERKLT